MNGAPHVAVRTCGAVKALGAFGISRRRARDAEGGAVGARVNSEVARRASRARGVKPLRGVVGVVRRRRAVPAAARGGVAPGGAREAAVGVEVAVSAEAQIAEIAPPFIVAVDILIRALLGEEARLENVRRIREHCGTAGDTADGQHLFFVELVRVQNELVAGEGEQRVHVRKVLADPAAEGDVVAHRDGVAAGVAADTEEQRKARNARVTHRRGHNKSRNDRVLLVGEGLRARAVAEEAPRVVLCVVHVKVREDLLVVGSGGDEEQRAVVLGLHHSRRVVRAGCGLCALRVHNRRRDAILIHLDERVSDEPLFVDAAKNINFGGVEKRVENARGVPLEARKGYKVRRTGVGAPRAVAIGVHVIVHLRRRAAVDPHCVAPHPRGVVDARARPPSVGGLLIPLIPLHIVREDAVVVEVWGTLREGVVVGVLG